MLSHEDIYLPGNISFRDGKAWFIGENVRRFPGKDVNEFLTFGQRFIVLLKDGTNLFEQDMRINADLFQHDNTIVDLSQ